MTNKFEINVYIKNYKNEYYHYKFSANNEKEAYKIYEEQFDEFCGKLDVDIQTAAYITLHEKMQNGDYDLIKHDEFSTYTLHIVEYINNQRTDREYRFNSCSQCDDQFTKIVKNIPVIEGVTTEFYTEQWFMYHEPVILNECILKSKNK